MNRRMTPEEVKRASDYIASVIEQDIVNDFPEERWEEAVGACRAAMRTLRSRIHAHQTQDTL
jgi:hypothetical protein